MADVTWYFTTWCSPVTGKWTGLAKRSPFVNGHPIYEPGDVWFEFGDTEDAALDAVRRSVLN